MREFRFVCTKEGTHWHCRVFSAEPGRQGAFLGKLVMDEQDYGELGTIGRSEPLSRFDGVQREAFTLLPGLLRADRAVATKLRLFTEHLCFDCGARIDPHVCGCGTELDAHDMHEEHPFRPMGCECGRDRS